VHDLRSYIRHLEKSGELVRISREVDPRFEMAAVMEQLEQRRLGFIFENVKGSRFPAVGGLFNKLERYGEALGYKGSAPFGHSAFDAMLRNAKEHPVEPRVVATSPVKEVIQLGTDVDISALPVPTFYELDSGPFITAAVGIARDPDSGVQNIGVYRTLILGPNRVVINASSLSDLIRIYGKWKALGQAMPIALAIGVDPAMLVSAACKLAPDQSEIGVAGGLQGSPLELVKCETSDLLVPAHAEFIVEGRVDFSERVDNTLGEFAGQYGAETASPTEVTAITHRRDAMFYTIMAGRNPEHNTLGGVAVYDVQRSISSALREAIPQIKDLSVTMQPGLGTLAHVVISIDKKNDAEPGNIIETAFKAGGNFFPVSKITKRITVVDTDIDVNNAADVEWAVWNRTARAEKYQVIPDIQSWELERCAKDGMKSLRIGIDATMDMEDVEDLIRPVTPGAEKIHLEDYIDNAEKLTS
jgi:2,5-furandicarboxylate decarboxylase 1